MGVGTALPRDRANTTITIRTGDRWAETHNLISPITHLFSQHALHALKLSFGAC